MVAQTKRNNMAERGKFIVIYGANNLGKTLQTEMLTQALQENGVAVQRLKYPIYDLLPTGPIINAVLREGKPMEDYQLQQTYARNRKDFEPTLLSYLTSGKWVLAEDYKGTGIAWGLTKGVSLEELEKMNAGLLDEDLAIVLHGERFLTGKETQHRHEGDDKIWELAQKNHLFLAERYRWQKVYANQTPERVHQDIWQVVKDRFSLSK